MKKAIIKSVEDVDVYVSKNCEGQKHTHYYKINESGLIECFECRKPVVDSDDIKNVKRVLREQYGEMWKDKFNQLMEIKRLVLKGETAGLQVIIHGYEDDNNNLNIGKIFYDPR
ncbi:MAG TPA: hypothetical protein VJC13_03140 [Candidatus Paceibacterota bacterium]